MKKFIIIIALFMTINGAAQSYFDQQIQLSAYNIVFNGLVGGLSELTNNPRHVKPIKAFAHGFRNGAIGGIFIVSGKYLNGVYAYNEQITDWSSRAITSLGMSIVYNTGFSDKFLQYYNLDAFGVIMVRYDLINKKLCAKIMPAGIVGITITAANSNKFDFKNTLQTGFPCFITNTATPKVSTQIILGSTRVTSINVNHLTKHGNITRAHEIIHANQYLEYTNLNNIFMAKIKSYKSDKGIFKYIYVDFLYSDLAYGLNQLVAGKNAPYYKNFFEFEAESYATRQRVNRN